MELIEKASNYAEENVINVLKEAFAKVYADGYRDGYKDREEEITVDFRDNKTEFVDLGLPSGTLWSCDYEKSIDGLLYLTNEKAVELNIPTINQCYELYNSCVFSFRDNVVYCVGPNGNHLTFRPTGYKEIDAITFSKIVYFWINNEDTDHKVMAAAIGCLNNPWKDTRQMFPGYKLPIRLVRSK